MKKRTKPIFSPEFRLKTSQLMVDQRRTKNAAEATGIGHSIITKWVGQLREEHGGKTPTATPMTPYQRRINKLEKQLRQVEEEKKYSKTLQ